MRNRFTIASQVVLAGMSFVLMGSESAMAEETKSVVPRVAERLAAGQPVTVVFLGDSVTGVYYHTGGWRAYPEMAGLGLQQLYPKSKVTAVNAGISGNSTKDGLARLQKDVLDHKPHLVTVMFGLNDMVRVPMPEFQANLKAIIEKCRGIGAEVLLCTPNPMIDSGPGLGGRTTPKLVEYCDATKAVGKSLNVPVCDCYGAHIAFRESDPLGWRLMMSDPFHPNMDGHILNAITICKSISGRDVSLDQVPPPQPAIPKTLARLKAGEPIRILAMPPYDKIVEKSLRSLAPTAKIEVTPWPVEGQTLAQIEEVSKTVRQRAPNLDLVLIAVPLAVTPAETPPAEAGIASYTWILNWSLAFGYQEWDVVGIAPSVLKGDLSSSEKTAEEFARRLIKAQHLSLVARSPGDTASAEQILERWLRDQLGRK